MVRVKNVDIVRIKVDGRLRLKIKDIMPLPITNKDLDGRQKERRRVAADGTQINLVNLKTGPALHGPFRYEMLLSDFMVYLEAERSEEEGYDAVMTDCTEDGPLGALRERLRIPVIGPLEASMHLATMLGKTFSILALRGHEEPLFREQAREAGLEDRLVSVREVDVNFPELEEFGDESLRRDLLREGKLAVEKDHADVLVLGCTSFIGVEDYLMSELDVPVLQPGNVAVKIAELLHSLHLTQSRTAYPRGTEYYRSTIDNIRKVTSQNGQPSA
jgi:allantoin racemase